jgi:SAM-dependent methyltransferase
LVWRRNLTRGDNAFSGALPAAMLALAALVVVIMPSGIWLSYITGGPEQNWQVREGSSGIAQLWWNGDEADVRVNGEYMSHLPYHPRHVKQEIFLLAQPRREKVLVLGLGGAEIIGSLVEDAEVQSIDVVDRSRELPRILSGSRAAGLLHHALESPKVRILSADPRVAVGLYASESFDLVFDNLAFAWWAGATGVKSKAYFREIRRILKPEGVFLTGANYTARSRSAVLAGLADTFEIVKEHRHAEIVIATSQEPRYFDFRIIALTEPRAAIFGLNYTAPDALPAWFRNEFIPVDREQLQGVEPVRDDLLIYEYFWQPF